MSNLDDFKNIADNMMKDIKVSENLKEKTLRKRKDGSFLRRYRVLPAAAVGLAAVLTFAVMNPGLLKGKDRNIRMESTGGIVTPMIAPAGTGSNAGPTIMSGPAGAPVKPGGSNPDTAVSNDGKTVNTTTSSGEGKSVPGSTPLPNAGPIYRPGTVEEAQKYLGEDFRQPEYIPSGFERELVQVPVDMSKQGMEITLGYKTDKNLYSIRMKKGAASYEYFTGNKEVDINGVKAQLSAGKLQAGNTEVASEFTRIQWLYKEMLYTLEGQISEEEAIKVARSVK